MKTRFTRFTTAAMLALSVAGLAASAADARRGGSFGSRGARTHMAPRQTDGSPRPVAPVERSMTPRTPGQAAPAYNRGFGQAQPGRPAGSRFGGIAGGVLGGLVAGGLIGHFLGGGWNAGWGGGGAGGGMLSALLQIALLGGIVWLVIGFFRRRQRPAHAFAGGLPREADRPSAPAFGGGWGGAARQPVQQADTGADIDISARDQQDFERLLIDVQDAFGREDYARLRQITTPEIMSYLSEELGQNATQGHRNEVRDTRLIDAEVSEAWREGTADYATIAFRYESVDVLRDRTSGAIVGGSADTPSETLEYWTFVRGADDVWKLSAIQEA